MPDCPRCGELEKELAEAREQRNNLLDENEDLGIKLLKVKGEWPASDGSPMAIAYAKIAQLEAALKKYEQGCTCNANKSA